MARNIVYIGKKKDLRFDKPVTTKEYVFNPMKAIRVTVLEDIDYFLSYPTSFRDEGEVDNLVLPPAASTVKAPGKPISKGSGPIPPAK